MPHLTAYAAIIICADEVCVWTIKSIFELKYCRYNTSHTLVNLTPAIFSNHHNNQPMTVFICMIRTYYLSGVIIIVAFFRPGFRTRLQWDKRHTFGVPADLRYYLIVFVCHFPHESLSLTLVHLQQWRIYRNELLPLFSVLSIRCFSSTHRLILTRNVNPETPLCMWLCRKTIWKLLECYWKPGVQLWMWSIWTGTGPHHCTWLPCLVGICSLFATTKMPTQIE